MSSAIENYLMKTAQVSPVIMLSSGVIGIIACPNAITINYVVGFITVSALAAAQKALYGKYYGDNPLVKRPNPPPTGCGLFDKCPKTFKKVDISDVGLPSSHAYQSFYSAMYWSLVILFTKWPMWKKITISVFLFLIATAICWSRVRVGCHTIEQVGIGAMLGTGIGTTAYVITRAIQGSEP